MFSQIILVFYIANLLIKKLINSKTNILIERKKITQAITSIELQFVRSWRILFRVVCVHLNASTPNKGAGVYDKSRKTIRRLLIALSVLAGFLIKNRGRFEWITWFEVPDKKWPLTNEVEKVKILNLKFIYTKTCTKKRLYCAWFVK
jgi:hypothetical protein